jgi:hypothetical protein
VDPRMRENARLEATWRSFILVLGLMMTGGPFVGVSLKPL